MTTTLRSQPEPSLPDVRPLPAPLVHVLDDEPAIQALFVRLQHLLQAEVRTYARARDFLEHADLDRPGCLLLDLNLPDVHGLEVLREIARRGVELPVIVISGQANVTQAVQALKLGSLDFLEKPFRAEQALEAIGQALERDQLLRSQSSARDGLKARLGHLTPREREVMGLVVEGLPSKIIASRLAISPKTIEVHRANVMRKTGAGSLAELVRLAVAVG